MQHLNVETVPVLLSAALPTPALPPPAQSHPRPESPVWTAAAGAELSCASPPCLLASGLRPPLGRPGLLRTHGAIRAEECRERGDLPRPRSQEAAEQDSWADSHLVTAACVAHSACACSACGMVSRQRELLPSRPRPCAERSGVSPVPKKKGGQACLSLSYALTLSKKPPQG